MAATTKKRRHPGVRVAARTVPRLPPELENTTTRGRILKVALELFARKGFHGTSMRDLAEQAGVQPATIYGHFDSKDAMLEEIISVGHDFWDAALEAATIAAGPAPVDRLVALVKAQVTHHIRYAMVAVVSNGELHSLTPDAAARVMAKRLRGEERLVQVIEEGERDGSFAPLDATVSMLAIGSMGLRVANWYPGDYQDGPDELADLYAQYALRLVGARA
jgi:AcrR family transcriptional regulator